MAESWVSINLELDGTLHHDTETLRCWKNWSLGSERNLFGVPARWTTAFKSTNNVCLYLLAFHMVFELEDTGMIHPLSPWFLLDLSECVTSNLLLCAAFFAWASPRCGPSTQHFCCWRWCWRCSNYHHLGRNHSKFQSTETWTFGKFQDCGASGSQLAWWTWQAELWLQEAWWVEIWGVASYHITIVDESKIVT